MLVGTGCTQAGPATDTSLYTAKTVISKLFTRFFDTSAGSGPLLCTEDRGGPALVQSGGVWTLLGVNAAVLADDEGNIKGPNSSARLDGTEHQDIIKKIANAAGVDVCGVTKNCGTVTPGEPSCQMTAAPPTVRQGEAVVITLKSENATKASIDGVDVSVPNGTRTLSPQKLGSQQALGTVTSAAGKGATCSASYTVIPKGDPGAVSCTLTATPSQVSLGETVTLEITASNAATAASINGRSVKVPSDKLLVAADKKGDFSAVGFVSGGGASANCYAEYRVEDGGVAPTIPNYGVVKTHCGADLNAGTTGISSVCLGTLKKDPSVNHIGFTQLVYVKYNSGVTELLPIVARRPVSGSSTQDELGLFANGIIAGNSGATMDMRLATLTKTSGGEPSAIEGATQSGKNFRSTLTPQ